MSVDGYLLIAALGLIFVLSGVFSGSETALFSLDRIQLRRFERSRSRRERLVASVAAHPERLLAGLLFGNTLINIASSSVAVALARRIHVSVGADTLAAAAAFVDGLLILFLGEILPKGIAVQSPAGTARFYIPVLAPLLNAVRPAAKFLEGIALKILSLAGVRMPKTGPSMTRPELQLLFEDFSETEGFTEGESGIAANIFAFFETRAWEIMTPRVDIQGIAVDLDRDAMRARILEAKRTRLPVFRGSLDHIIGFINTKEFLLHPDRSLEELLKPVHFAPERARLSNILNEVQSRRLNMVVVVNEYGGTSGIITNKDLIEEVVGEIFDEGRQDQEPEVHQIGDRQWRVDGLLPIDDLRRELEVAIPEGPAQTVAGHVAHLLGRPPRPQESVRQGRVTFRVLEVERHRAQRLEIQVEAGRDRGGPR